MSDVPAEQITDRDRLFLRNLNAAFTKAGEEAKKQQPGFVQLVDAAKAEALGMVLMSWSHALLGKEYKP